MISLVFSHLLRSGQNPPALNISHRLHNKATNNNNNNKLTNNSNNKVTNNNKVNNNNNNPRSEP